MVLAPCLSECVDTIVKYMKTEPCMQGHIWEYEQVSGSSLGFFMTFLTILGLGRELIISRSLLLVKTEALLSPTCRYSYAASSIDGAVKVSRRGKAILYCYDISRKIQASLWHGGTTSLLSLAVIVILFYVPNIFSCLVTKNT